MSAASPTTTAPKAIIVADYFGEANPVNFWNSSLSNVRNDFLQIKHDGFNTVGLVIPWGEFQPGVDPIRYNNTAFTRLASLVAVADRLGLGVNLRLSYGPDNYPHDQMPGGARFMALFGSDKIYQAWLAYISKIHQTVARYHNVRGGYISWEDYWAPIVATQNLIAYPKRRRMAVQLNFQGWARQHYTLAQINQLYGTTYVKWSHVPTPPGNSAAYSLMYSYEDDNLINRLFVPASQRFPNLTMESRIDTDSWTTTTGVSSVTHTPTLQLPGTTVTGMYFSPYMHDPSTNHVETVPQATQALQTVLQTVQQASNGRKLFIYEYEIASNAPAIAPDPALPTDQVGPFVEASAPLLKQHTTGYGLWTYRDFNMSTLYNPSFSLGTSGWTVHGQAHAVNPQHGDSYLSMAKGSSVRQVVQPAVQSGGPTATVSFSADSSGKAAQLHVHIGPVSKTVQIGPHLRTYELQVPSSALNGTALSFTSSGATLLTNVQAYSFTQQGDVYTTTDTPGPSLPAIRSLNDELASSTRT